MKPIRLPPPSQRKNYQKVKNTPNLFNINLSIQQLAPSSIFKKQTRTHRELLQQQKHQEKRLIKNRELLQREVNLEIFQVREKNAIIHKTRATADHSPHHNHSIKSTQQHESKPSLTRREEYKKFRMERDFASQPREEEPTSRGMTHNSKNYSEDPSLKQRVSEKLKKIFVGGYDSLTQKEELFNYFSRFGEIKRIITKFDDQGTAKGYCFIKFYEVSSAKRVLDHKEHRLNNRILECRPVMKGKMLKESLKRIDNRRVFISNICKQVDKRMLEELLSAHVPLENTYLVSKKRKPTAIAFVTLRSEEDVEILLEKSILAGGKKLVIRKYKRKFDVQKEKERKLQGQERWDQDFGDSNLGLANKSKRENHGDWNPHLKLHPEEGREIVQWRDESPLVTGRVRPLEDFLMADLLESDEGYSGMGGYPHEDDLDDNIYNYSDRQTESMRGGRGEISSRFFEEEPFQRTRRPPRPLKRGQTVPSLVYRRSFGWVDSRTQRFDRVLSGPQIKEWMKENALRPTECVYFQQKGQKNYVFQRHFSTRKEAKRRGDYKVNFRYNETKSG